MPSFSSSLFSALSVNFKRRQCSPNHFHVIIRSGPASCARILGTTSQSSEWRSMRFRTSGGLNLNPRFVFTVSRQSHSISYCLVMAKPLLSSTFLSFPKLLLWSLPLVFILIYTYLGAGFGLKLSTFTSVISSLGKEKGTSTAPMRHDESFTPDYVLRVSEQQFTQSCIMKDSVILVNGTSPGPELRLTEGNIYWVRVFNDMENKNLTMASEPNFMERSNS